MARIYRLQLNKATTQALQQGKSIATEIMVFDSDDEKRDFVKDPEAFARKAGLLTDDMPFNGLVLPSGITLDKLQNDPSLVTTMGPAVIHEPSCQLAWDI